MAALVLAGAAVAVWAGGGGLEAPPEPVGNPLTAAKANLGKVLFWDEQVSSTGTVACGTCHIPAVGGGDPRGGQEISRHPGPDETVLTDDDIFGSPGVVLNHADGLYDESPLFGLLPQVTRRRTTSAINAGYAPDLFWDGRAPGEFRDPITEEVVPGMETGAALESQAVGPPVNDVEMGHVASEWTSLLARLATSVPLALSPEMPVALEDWIAGRSYPELFEEAFGTPELTATRFAMAVASFERTQFTDATPYDEFLDQGSGDCEVNLILTAEECAGLDVFNGQGGCNNCHQPPLLAFELGPLEDQFRYTGVRPQADDLGRAEVTEEPTDEGKMRIPSLRNLELRAPYMHNGRFATIQDVIEFYDRGGDFGPPENPNLDPAIGPLNLTQQQKDDLLAFLTRPLTDPRLAAGLAPFDRPTLYTESSRVPTIEGTGVPGSGDFVPVPVALEPPVLGNPSFTVAVWNALGGADALLVIDDQDPGTTAPACSGQLVCQPVVLQGGAGVPGAGFGSVSVSIPNDAALAGAEWFGRWYVDDVGGGFPGAVSPVIRFTTFRGRQLAAIFADGFESADTSAWDTTVN